MGGQTGGARFGIGTHVIIPLHTWLGIHAPAGRPRPAPSSPALHDSDGSSPLAAANSIIRLGFVLCVPLMSPPCTFDSS